MKEINFKFISFLVVLLIISSMTVKSQEQAKPADAFVESIGIGDRFDWLNDDGNLGNAQTALSSLKIRYVRVGISAESGSSTYIANTKNMASTLGLKLCVVTEVYNTWSTQQAWLNTWRGYAGTTAVEGPNEVGNNSAVAGIQQSIWNYAHPLGMEVYAWTLGAQAGYYRTEGVSNGGATVDDYCDYLNFHPYHWYTYNYSANKMNGLWQNGDFDNLGFGTSGCINQVRTMANNQSKPFVSTEFGWCINGLEQGVSINYAKKYLVRNCFENFNAGMHRGFIFSLTNYGGAGADYALASSTNGSLNATGQTVANTISILQEPGKSTISTTSLNYSLTGISGTSGNAALTFPTGADDRNAQNDEIHHTLLQKSNGVYYLVLWCDYDSHNGEDGWAQNATLNLPAGASSVKAYLPMNGTGVMKDYGAVASGGSVALNTSNGTAIPDHPLIIEIASGTGTSNPDLVVTSISWSPASPSVGNEVTFSAVVKNQGTAETPAGITIGVNFSVDGTGVSWHGSYSSALAAGASVTLTADGGPTKSTWTATAGNHTIMANVDDVNRITESNESNNTLSSTLTIGGVWTIVDDAATGWIWNGFANDPCALCYNGTSHSTNVRNKTATYTFTGTDVEAYCETYPGEGSVKIYIDNVLKGTFSQDITPVGGGVKFATITGLTNASHTIKFTSTSSKWVGIDYIRFAVNPAKSGMVETSIENLSTANINIFPNPAFNEVTIEFNNSSNNDLAQVIMIDLLGKIVYQTKATDPMFMQLNVNELSKGVYILNVVKGLERFNHKIIIK